MVAYSNLAARVGVRIPLGLQSKKKTEDNGIRL